jgi:polyisoprenoid-binding protein YceI
MKLLKSLAIASGLLALPQARTQAGTWDIDPAHSTVEFSVRHMMVTTVKGQFQKVKGTVQLDEKDPGKSSVEAEIEATSIDTREPKRDGHLKSAEFFDVARFPVLTFKSTKVEKAGKGKLKVTGDLTMHGVTKPVVLTVEGPSAAMKDPFGRTVRGLTATGRIDRKDWGMTWNKALDTGGVLVSDEVKLDINAELAERPPAAPAQADGEKKAAPPEKAVSAASSTKPAAQGQGPGKPGK